MGTRIIRLGNYDIPKIDTFEVAPFTLLVDVK